MRWTNYSSTRDYETNCAGFAEEMPATSRHALDSNTSTNSYICPMYRVLLAKQVVLSLRGGLKLYFTHNRGNDSIWLTILKGVARNHQDGFIMRFMSSKNYKNICLSSLSKSQVTRSQHIMFIGLSNLNSISPNVYIYIIYIIYITIYIIFIYIIYIIYYIYIVIYHYIYTDNICKYRDNICIYIYIDNICIYIYI